MLRVWDGVKKKRLFCVNEMLMAKDHASMLIHRRFPEGCVRGKEIQKGKDSLLFEPSDPNSYSELDISYIGKLTS